MKKKGVKQHPCAGHRRRLRDRFLQCGLDGFLDYEIIELLLTLGTPRKDCKQIAKAAIKKFNGLQGVLDASIEELKQIKGIGRYNAFGIKLFQAIGQRYAKEKISNKIYFTKTQEVAYYLRKKLGRRKREYLIAIYLNARNEIIKTKTISIGTVIENLVHPRELYAPAIKNHAVQIIIGHNHPSGNSLPSREDVKVTKMLLKAGKILGIKLVDHIIVTNQGYTSFKEEGLLE